MAAEYAECAERMAAEYAECAERIAAEYAEPAERIAAEYAEPAERIAAEYAECAERMAAEHAEPAERMAAEYAECAERIAAEYAEPAERIAAEYTKPAEPLGLRMMSRLIAASDRQAILGDLLEEAEYRALTGARRDLWLTAECGAIAGGLSLDRARGWVVVPPARELAAGLALDGSRAFRGGHSVGALMRALIFCGTVATLALGASLLVGALLSAAGL
jgi:hypothetical protein